MACHLPFGRVDETGVVKDVFSMGRGADVLGSSRSGLDVEEVNSTILGVSALPDGIQTCSVLCPLAVVPGFDGIWAGPWVTPCHKSALSCCAREWWSCDAPRFRSELAGRCG